MYAVCGTTMTRNKASGSLSILGLNYSRIPYTKSINCIRMTSLYSTCPDSIPPSDRRWPNVSTSVGPTLAADVGKPMVKIIFYV